MTGDDELPRLLTAGPSVSVAGRGRRGGVAEAGTTRQYDPGGEILVE
ncbi:hypothetical protein [Micromonospora thermarum]|uniref:Lasso RiPP family leader peptide-containing protein n=1 Tax=Micromonospora thermarum TaxID=2720024 RepID=A0ABX0ZAG6_9ACTN|nr:hypothetical protein [Micromonospora thermarum]NJP32955.1 hypothetical protein [Micromonospora thermarum]